MNIKRRTPWQAKIAAKLVFSRLPLNYGTWARLGLFRHGDMDRIGYAYGVFKKHYERIKPTEGFSTLELGPGDSLASAFISRAFGGSTSYLIDVGAYASKDLEFYCQLAEFLKEKGMVVPDVEIVSSVEELLTFCDGHYLNNGLSSLRSLPSQSIDFIYSHSCLEHISATEFLETMQELRRVIRDLGGCSHRVDLQDHLGGALNSLRFSDQTWESDFMSSSGFYTNRIRFYEMKSLFEMAGFAVQYVEIDRWNNLPTPKSKLSKRFRKMDDEELNINGFAAILRPV
jgi:hypothetical protein